MEYRDFVDELLNKTDLITLISRYTKLVKKGNDYWACCPFHNEKEPSFKIYNATKSYHCFGCKASGNAITFLSQIESISRYDAIKLLAEQAGMTLPESSFKLNEDKETIQKRERLYALMRDAAKYYHENLWTPAGKDMLDYLTNRGITKKSIIRFGLGASTSSTGVIDALKEKGYSLDEMHAAALIDMRADRWFDVYSNRVMFPIINIMGQVVSFSGRVLGKSDIAKYRNGAQSIIFDKSKNLYGINLAKKGKSILDYLIIVEGHIDAVSMHQAGYITTVASMGTALTSAQAKQLKNISSKVYISYDGDAAGQKATMRGLDILANAGLNVKVVELPDGKDPDDILRLYGKEYYDELLKNAVPLTSFKIKTMAKSYDLGAQDEKAEFAVNAVKIIKQLDNPIEQEEYLGQIQELTGYSMSVLKQQASLDQEENTPKMPEKEQIVEKANKNEKAIIFILASLIAKADYAKCNERAENFIPEGIYRKIYEKIRNDESVTSLFSELDENDASVLNEVLNYEFMEGDNEDKFLSCITELKIVAMNERKKALEMKYKETKDEGTLMQIAKCIKIIDGMKNKGGH